MVEEVNHLQSGILEYDGIISGVRTRTSDMKTNGADAFYFDSDANVRKEASFTAQAENGNIQAATPSVSPEKAIQPDVNRKRKGIQSDSSTISNKWEFLDGIDEME